MDKGITNIVNQIVSKPEHWLAYINLAGDTVIGKVKDKMALIESIPNPQTNFRFNDVIEVEGPVGTSLYRDEMIPVFNGKRAILSSQLPTFTFDAVVPSSEAWFDLSSIFEEKGKVMRFPYQGKNANESWQTGFCIASSIMEAELILEEYIVSGKGRRVRNLYDVFDNSQYIIPEVLNTKLISEFKYPISFRRGATAITLIPLTLCVFIAIKIGSKSTFDLIGISLSILVLGVFTLCVYLYLKNWELILDKDGLLLKSPFRKRRQIFWEEVLNVKYYKKNAFLLLEDRHKNRIKVSKSINNFRRFCLIAKNLIKSNINTNEFTKALKV